MSETGVNLFDYVNCKEVFVQSVYMAKCFIVIGGATTTAPTVPRLENLAFSVL